MILGPLFCFKDTKNTGLLTFNSLKQKKLISNFFVDRNWKILTQPRPQGFSLKKWVGPAPPIFWGKSPGDEVDINR